MAGAAPSPGSFIGVDLGTSAVKAVLVDEEQRVLATATRDLDLQQPQPLWSEQDPDQWVAACIAVIADLRTAAPARFRACAGIGLAGQMHGAVLLDAADRPLRPCILWNDGRSAQECAEIEAAAPAARSITGNIAMPGFTAPKVAWVRRYEPEIFRRTRRVLLPKAYVRLVLTGEAIEEMSDAAGSLWLDVGRRCWSETMLEATGLGLSHMPRLVEGSAPAGRLREELSASLGFDRPPLLAGGAGDNAAGAVGIGAVHPGDAFLSLGTSGVLWRTTGGYAPRADSAVHSFCHALPGLWHHMSVHLAAGASLRWWAGITRTGEKELLAPLGDVIAAPSPVLFTPYLSGERTPHNDPRMRGGFHGLGMDAHQADMTQAVLEGVAFALLDGKRAIEGDGERLSQLMAIGGGARSALWLSILANVLGVPLRQVDGGEAGAAFGAARLARLVVTGEDIVAVCLQPAGGAIVEPVPAMMEAYAGRHAAWREASSFSREIANAL